MKTSLLRLLVCPACKLELRPTERARDGAEIVEGTLACDGCRRIYPVTRGIPRFVPDGGYAESFGHQWNRFRTVQLDSQSRTGESARTFDATTGWSEADCRGALALDAGVGAGRFAEVASARGAEVVGVDLTAAVDAAKQNLGRRENVHLVQADIFALPFREGSFDLVYSIGVLHHTPNPRAAFGRVAGMVKKGGQCAVYLYDAYGNWYRSSDLLRKLTTRLPHPLMVGLAGAAVPLYYVYKVPLLGSLGRLLLPVSSHPDWRWRWLDTFDWYTPTYQWKFRYPEVLRWFRAEGFADVEVFDGPIRLRGVKAS